METEQQPKKSKVGEMMAMLEKIATDAGLKFVRAHPDPNAVHVTFRPRRTEHPSPSSFENEGLPF